MMVFEWPQIVYLCFFVVSLLMNIHASFEKSSGFPLITQLLAAAVTHTLLYFGGFWTVVRP